MDTLLVTGIIRGSHGVKGFLKVDSLSGDFEHFSSLKAVTLSRGAQQREMVVEEVRSAGRYVLVKFEGIDSPEVGRRYSGWEIRVPRTLAAKRDGDEWYVADLIGCEITCNDTSIGSIVSVVENAPDALIEIELSDGKRRLVPFRNEFIGGVDVEERRVELLEEWILE